MKKLILGLITIVVVAIAALYFSSSKQALRQAVGPEIPARTVKLYYYSPSLDKDAGGNVLCSPKGLVAVERNIPVSKTPIQDTLRLLLKGRLTDEERSFGVTTEFPLEGLELQGASLNKGNLTLEFADPNHKTVGGSCRVAVLWSQIEATMRQFPEVASVRFIPEELFQP